MSCSAVPSVAPARTPSLHFDFLHLSATGAFPIEPIYKRRLAHNLSQPDNLVQSISPRSSTAQGPLSQSVVLFLLSTALGVRLSHTPTCPHAPAHSYTPCRAYQRPEVADALMILIHSLRFVHTLLFLFSSFFYCFFPFWPFGDLLPAAPRSNRPLVSCFSSCCRTVEQKQEPRTRTKNHRTRQIKRTPYMYMHPSYPPLTNSSHHVARLHPVR